MIERLVQLLADLIFAFLGITLHAKMAGILVTVSEIGADLAAAERALRVVKVHEGHDFN